MLMITTFTKFISVYVVLERIFFTVAFGDQMAQSRCRARPSCSRLIPEQHMP